jgi:hypothetical protein
VIGKGKFAPVHAMKAHRGVEVSLRMKMKLAKYSYGICCRSYILIAKEK